MKKTSQTRTVVGAGLLVLGSLGMAAAFVQILPRVIIEAPVPARMWVVLSLSVGLIGIASVATREPSVLWQGMLQASAVGGFIVGLSILLDIVLSTPGAIISVGGLWGALVLVAAIFSAVLMRKLQKRRKGRSRNVA